MSRMAEMAMEQEDDSMMMHYYQVELPALQKEQEELRALWDKMIDDPEFVAEYNKFIDSNVDFSRCGVQSSDEATDAVPHSAGK